MRIKDRTEDAMLDKIAWQAVWVFRIGDGVDPKWLQIRAEKDAKTIDEILSGWQAEGFFTGYKGMYVTWPRNLAVFKGYTSATEAKARLWDIGIITGEIMKAAALPDLKEVRIKDKKWEGIK